MRKRARAVQAMLISIAASWVSPASAGFVSGAQLKDICKADEQGSGNPLLAAECLGFVTGVADTFDCVEKLHGFTWNATSDVNQSQLVKAVEKWLESHPAVLAYEADGLVAAALSDSFPCQ